MELKAGDDIILRSLPDESISGDFGIDVSMLQCFAFFQNFKRNRRCVSFIVVRGFCLDNRVAAIRDIVKVYFTFFIGGKFHHCFSIGVVKCKLCTGERSLLIFVNLQNFDTATNKSVLKADGACFAGLDFNGFCCLTNISVGGFNFFNSINAFKQFQVELALCICDNSFINYCSGIGCAGYTEFQTFYNAILGGLLDKAVAGDFCISLRMSDGLAVFQNFKRNWSGVGFVIVRSLGFYYCVLAVRNAVERNFTVCSGSKLLYDTVTFIVQGKFCTGERRLLVFVNLNDLDVATNEFVLKVDGCGFAGLDLDFLLFRLYISVRSVNLFYSVSAF